MAERIIATDPKAKALEERCTRELEAFYPDLVIERSVQADHKKLSERLTEARKLLGYEDLKSMLETWGFTVNYSKGRQRTLDPETLVAEIVGRYEGREAPATIDLIRQENPDLSGKIKTTSNEAKTLWGHGLKDELIARGLVFGKAKARPNKRASLAEVADADIFDSIDRMRAALASTPIDERPEKLRDLKKIFPQEAGYIVAGGKRGITDKNTLANIGLLRPSYKVKNDLSVRRVGRGEDTLAKLFEDAFGTNVIKPGDELEKFLAPGVIGINLTRSSSSTQEGTYTHDEEVLKKERLLIEPPNSKKEVAAGDKIVLHKYGKVCCPDSPLSDYCEPWEKGSDSYYGRVLSVYKSKGTRLALVEITYLDSLAHDSLAQGKVDALLYALHKRGVITDADLAGDPGWRYRLGIGELAERKAAALKAREEGSPAEAPAVDEPACEIEPKSEIEPGLRTISCTHTA
jgi:hypothetical protein